jgi:sulfite dehydrogenase
VIRKLSRFLCAWWVGLSALTLLLPSHAAGAEERERGKLLFTTVQPACATCHTLQAAGAEGQVGPVLDEIKPDATRVLRAVRAGLGVMPSYAERLTERDMRALAEFVAHATGGAALPAER